MKMLFKNQLKRILGIYNFDREAERLIRKSIKVYQKGGKLNKWRSIRLQNIILKKFNCSIPPYIEIGPNFYIAHPQGVTLGRTAKIGKNCRIYPYAAIIASVKGDHERSEKKIRRHAVIGDNCVLGYGCMVIGPITIGDNVVIGAGAIVTKDVPSNCMVKNVNEIKEIEYERYH